MVDRLVPRLGPSVEEDAYLGVQLPANGIEEPPVGVDLFRILLLETKDDLDGNLSATFSMNSRDCWGLRGEAGRVEGWRLQTVAWYTDVSPDYGLLTSKICATVDFSSTAFLSTPSW